MPVKEINERPVPGTSAKDIDRKVADIRKRVELALRLMKQYPLIDVSPPTRKK